MAWTIHFQDILGPSWHYLMSDCLRCIEVWFKPIYFKWPLKWSELNNKCNNFDDGGFGFDLRHILVMLWIHLKAQGPSLRTTALYNQLFVSSGSSQNKKHFNDLSFLVSNAPSWNTTDNHSTHVISHMCLCIIDMLKKGRLCCHFLKK